MLSSSWKSTLNNYIKTNYKEFILVALIFIIGIFIGVLVVNSCSESQSMEIKTYFNDFVNRFKNYENIDKLGLIINTIKNNVILAVVLWVAGTTVIGIPIVLMAIFFRGLILGFTISAVTFSLGIFKGIMFCLASIFLQNVLFIPAILTIGVSSIKLYKSIIKDKRKDNIKVEVIRHTIISIIMVVVLIVSAVVENVVSITILKKVIKFF